MATGIGTAASQPPPPPLLAHRRMRAANLEAETAPDSSPDPAGSSRCLAMPATYAAGFEQAPWPTTGTATARSRRVRRDDIPCGTEPRRTLLCDERGGREKSKQRELAAAAERASCPKLAPRRARTRRPSCPAGRRPARLAARARHARPAACPSQPGLAPGRRPSVTGLVGTSLSPRWGRALLTAIVPSCGWGRRGRRLFSRVPAPGCRRCPAQHVCALLRPRPAGPWGTGGSQHPAPPNLLEALGSSRSPCLTHAIG